MVDKIEINVGELKVGESIKVKDLPIYQNKDIDILTDPEATVVTIQEVHNAPEADEEAEESTRSIISYLRSKKDSSCGTFS